MTLPSIALHDDGAVSCATVLWRFRGRLQLTVVVKALFTLVPDGIAAPAGPGAIAPADRHRDNNPTRSVEAASDLAPYLARCDVLFSGHAYAPGGRAPAGSVRLGVARDGRPLLDKTLHVFGDRAPGAAAPEPFTRIPIVYERTVGVMGEPNPAGNDAPNLVDPADPRRPVGFGPIGHHWPARRRLLASLDRKAIEGPVAEIPEAMPWAYFQRAPPDQQIEHLRGGEWLVLDGLHPTLPRVQTRLAAARGVARVTKQRPDAPEQAMDQAIDLACDTLAIDGDRQTFALSWRGRCDLAEADAGPLALTVRAALEVPGVPVDWPAILARAVSAAPAGPAAAPADLGSTSLAVSAPVAAPLPFAKEAAAAVLDRLPVSPPVRLPAKGGKATMALSLEDLAPPAQPLPFAVEAPLKAPSWPPPPPAVAGLPGAPWGPPAVPPKPPREDADTTDMPQPAVVPRLPAEPPPAVAAAPRSTPPPPLADPWAKPEAPPAAPEPPKRTQPPPAFERPAAAGVKASIYARFKR